MNLQRRLLREFHSDNPPDLVQKDRNMVAYRLPHEGPVDSKILVHQNVSEADNVCPGNQWILLCQFRTEPGGCLADDG